MGLLFPVFAFAMLLCIKLFQRYAFRGEAGRSFLLSSAEGSGDYRKLLRLNALKGALLIVSLLVLGFLVVYGALVSLAFNGKKGVGMDFARQYGPRILAAVFVGFFLLLTVVRLLVRRRMKRAEARGEPPLPADGEFRVCYTEHSRRIGTMMAGIVFLVFLTVFPIMMIRSPYVDAGTGIVFLVLVLAGLVFLIVRVIRARGKVCVLLVMNREGITDCNPSGSVGFIPWREVSDVSVSSSEIALTLTGAADAPEGKAVVRIQLGLTPISSDTIYRKLRQYLLLSGQQLPPPGAGEAPAGSDMTPNPGESE